MNSNRSRRRSWSYSRDSDFTNNNPFITERSIVRQGPLCIGLALIFCVPMLILSFTDTTLPPMNHQQQHDLRGAPAWMPSQQQQQRHSYAGDTLHQSGWTLESRILGETATARCDVHTLQNKKKNQSVDWIILEQHDRVMVAVMDQSHQNWILMKQRHYAIPGPAVLSPLEGVIDRYEHPFHAAQRIVQEQTGLESRPTQVQQKVELDEHGIKDGHVPPDANDWKFLGRYRTMADRGGGWIYCYLVRVQQTTVKDDFRPKPNELGEQPLVITMSLEQVRQAMNKGDFVSLASAATISLALQQA